MSHKPSPQPSTEKALNSGQIEALVNSFLTQGNTFKNLKGVSEASMQALYSMAYSVYNSGRYEDAQKVFQFLCFFDHYQKKYWMGLAACRQMLKDYQNAASAYAYAALLDVHDPVLPLHAADCFLAMGNRKAAESALHATIKWSDKKEEHKDLRQRAEAILKLLAEPAK